MKKKKKMISLTEEEKKLHCKQNFIIYCKKEFSCDDKKYYKDGGHDHYTGKYRGTAHNICNLRCKIPKGIVVVLHNGSTYGYHFIIKIELAEGFKGGEFECLE